MSGSDGLLGMGEVTLRMEANDNLAVLLIGTIGNKNKSIETEK